MTTSKEDSARLLWEQLPDSAREAFEQARPMLGIPLTLQGAVPIADNLMYVRRRVQTQICAERVEPVWQFIDEICRLPREDWLIKDPWLRAMKVGDDYKDPLHGCKASYPVWSALWFRHHRDDRDGPRAGQPDAGSEYAWVYQGLQAQYVAGYLRLTSGQREELKSRVEVAGRSIRQLHGRTDEDHDYVLEWLHEAIGDPGALFEELVAAKDKLQGAATQSMGYGLGCLAEVLRVAHGLSVPSVFEERHPGHRRSFRRGTAGPRDDANRLWPQHAYYHYFNGKTGHAELGAEGGTLEVEEPDEETHRKILDAGLDPREYRGAGETAWVNVQALTDGPEEELVQLAPLASLYAAARGRARQMRMQVQRLPFDRGRVRLAELATLTSAMAADYEAFARAEPTKKKERENRTQALRMLRVAATALTTGTKPSRLLPKGQFQAIESAKDLPYDYQLAVNLEHRMWVRPYDPPARNPLRGEESGGAIDMRPRVALPDIWSVTANTVAEDQVADWNTHKSATLEAHWQAFLGRHDLSSVRKRWLSFDGLADILPSWWLGLEEGAQLERQMLFRRDDALASVHHYYTAYDRQALANRYKSIMWDLGGRIGIPEDPQDGQPRLFARKVVDWDAPINWVGDDRVLRLEAMGAIVEKARERLLGAVDRGDPYERHNAMATYTGLGLALATGFRTVRTPIVDLTAIHAETRTLCLQEKDRWDGQDARLVPLPEAVYDQVCEYLRHLRQLWTQLSAARSAVLPIPATKARDQRVYGHEAFDLVLNRSLFFFEQSEEGHQKPVELTGDRLQRELNALVPGYWPIPNAGRHALRSWLIRHGAEANLVNALMGHAYYGEEHWAPTSALDPVAYRRGILPYLEQLTQTLGYRVVRS